MENRGSVDILTTNKLVIPHTKLFLAILNCLLLIAGNSAGPLLLRLYYLHGGRRQWFSSFLQTASFPLLILPLSLSFLRRRRSNPLAPLFHLNTRVLLSSAAIGILTGLDDFLYAYALNFLPVSTSSVLIATQLAFTAIFAFFIVRLKFTPFSLNAVALLTVGAVLLALHTGGDRPRGITAAEYWKGFVLTLGAAALYGLLLPVVELTYDSFGRAALTYTLVMEMQLVIGFFATGFCAVGMLANRDLQAIPREAAEYGLGKTKYYLVIIAATISWQSFFLGAIGVIFCVNTLLAGVMIAALIPVIELLAFFFLHENFSSEKGVALLLALWGLASYSYGEYRQLKEKKKKQQEHHEAAAISAV